MNEEDRASLKSLLTKLKTFHLEPPNTPYDVWLELATLLPMPTVEVIITHDGKDFLLTERHDSNWDGWHIPGGFTLYQESIPDACSRIAKKELGIVIKFLKVLDVFVWKDHPYGAPVSIICICTTDQEPHVGKFFREVPEKMVNHHADFLKNFLQTRE